MHRGTGVSKKGREPTTVEPLSPTWISSTGVLSEISRKMTMQRLWFGRTLRPSSSTCTLADWRRTSVMRAMSLVSFFTWLKLATVQIGTYWSLSIWLTR